MAYLNNTKHRTQKERFLVATHLPMAYLNNDIRLATKKLGVESRYPPSDGLPEQRFEKQS